MSHSNDNHSVDLIRERACLYALGALSSDEAEAFEQHIGSGCDACRDELRAFQTVTAELARAVPVVAARPVLRSRVLERIAAEAHHDDWTKISKEGLHFVRPQGLDWTTVPGVGIEVKVLNRDDDRDVNTTLVRMDPGAVIPTHRHLAEEEIYVVQGDLLVGDVLMRAGDYCHAAAGALHRSVTSFGGCVFLSKTSATDAQHLLELGGSGREDA